MSSDVLESSLHIEYLDADNETWTIIGDAPIPFHARDTSQILSEDVWIAYVDYLNTRERDRDGHPENRYRLVRWFIKRSKVIVHV